MKTFTEYLTEAKKYDKVYFMKGFYAKNPPNDSTIIYPQNQKDREDTFVIISLDNQSNYDLFKKTYKDFLSKNKMWSIEELGRYNNVPFTFKFTNVSNKEIPFSKLKEQLIKFYKQYFRKDVTGDMCFKIQDTK